MKTEYISGGRGYDVPYIHSIHGQEKTVCVVVHGFGSSKKSATATMLFNDLPPLGIGVAAFDFPSHGESGADGEFFRISNCIADLAAVEARARTLAPDAEIVYFASSFGAYIALLYLAGLKQGNRRAFLRCPAVSMPRVANQLLTPEMQTSLKVTGAFTLDKATYGYGRDLKLTQGFFDDLSGHDVYTLWREGFARLCMIHGELDQTIPLGDAGSFAEMFNVPLTVVANGDHQLATPGVPKQVLKLAVEFFK